MKPKEVQEVLDPQVYKKFKLIDYIIVCSVLLISVVIFLFFNGNTTGNTAFVKVQGKYYGKYSLLEDRTVSVVSELGKSEISIKDGQVCIVKSDCPDKICMSEQPIKRMGQSIVCLPLKMVVYIGDNNEELAY